MFNFYKIHICGQTENPKGKVKKQTYTVYVSIKGLLNFDVTCKEIFKHESDDYFVIHSLTFLVQYCLNPKELDYFNSFCHFLFENEIYDSIKVSPQRSCHSKTSLSYNFYVLSFESIAMINVFDQEKLSIGNIYYGIHNMVNMRLFLMIDFDLQEEFYELKTLEILAQYSMPKKISSEFECLRYCKTITHNKIASEIEIQERNMRIDSLLDL